MSCECTSHDGSTDCPNLIHYVIQTMLDISCKLNYSREPGQGTSVKDVVGVLLLILVVEFLLVPFLLLQLLRIWYIFNTRDIKTEKVIFFVLVIKTHRIQNTTRSQKSWKIKTIYVSSEENTLLMQ